eukprot:1143514-Amphidinium_carterae.1
MVCKGKTNIEECWNGDPTRRPSSEDVAKQHLDRVEQLRYEGDVTREVAVEHQANAEAALRLAGLAHNSEVPTNCTFLLSACTKVCRHS